MMPIVCAAIIAAAIFLIMRRKKNLHNSADLTMTRLKEALEGVREQEHKAPDVFLTILEVHVLHKGFRVADLSTFHLQGLRCKARLEVEGTVAQLAGMITADAATWVFAAASAGETAAAKALGVTRWGLGEKAAVSAASVQDTLAERAAEGCEIKCVDFEFVVNLEKTFGQEAVVAKAQIIKSSLETLNKVMSVSIVQMYIEDMFSRRVTAFITKWWKENEPTHDDSTTNV